MRTIAVIPARYRSERLPGKPLAEIAGRPMVEHVYRRAARARSVERVLVATDDERVREAVAAFGGESVMTSPHHPSGTDRVAEAVADLDAELVVNVQGDEPFLDPLAIDQAVEACRREEGRAIATLCKPILSAEELWDPNVVKVVTDRRGFALYFSRWPIPFEASSTMNREAIRRRLEAPTLPEKAFYRHVGLYVYPKSILLDLARRGPTPLESAERLEQLRALENGFPIRVEETDYQAIAVDTISDLERVREMASRLESSAGFRG